MTITKFGHSCLMVEEAGVRILIDPGVYSTVPNDLPTIDLILLTHEHADHTDPHTLEQLLVHHPNVQIRTNQGVGAVLTKHEIPFELLEGGTSLQLSGVPIEAIGTTHELIVQNVPPVANTGYLIANRLFVPGDAFTNPGKPVDILALPIAAPWSKFAETLEYALSLKPSVIIPIHDGFLTPKNPFIHWVHETLPAQQIRVEQLEPGESVEL